MNPTGNNPNYKEKESVPWCVTDYGHLNDDEWLKTQRKVHKQCSGVLDKQAQQQKTTPENTNPSGSNPSSEERPSLGLCVTNYGPLNDDRWLTVKKTCLCCGGIFNPQHHQPTDTSKDPKK